MAGSVKGRVNDKIHTLIECLPMPENRHAIIGDFLVDLVPLAGSFHPKVAASGRFLRAVPA